MPETYDQKKHKYYTQKIRSMLDELPSMCGTFLRGIENQTSVLTRYGYLVDLHTFFVFLTSNIDLFTGIPIADLTLQHMEQVQPLHVELYLEYISVYQKVYQEQERTIVNHERAKARKLSTLRSFFKYFYKKEMLKANVLSMVDLPKLHQKAIVRLEPNEIASLLDIVEQGAGLSEKQKKYLKFTQKRDIAILTLFLGTGIRISELIGIDLKDVDFSNNSFLVTRKGGNQDILVFGDEVRSALLQYLLERQAMHPVEGHEHALFLSMQRKRIGARAVEKLVKKYTNVATPLKKISPHKLRSTFGTMLYQETGDIYLVADVLGHKDVNTTKKHYAAISQDRRRIAAQVIRLREDETESETPSNQDNK